MLSKAELIEGVEERYHEMLKKVDISNFTKCIATLADLGVNEIPNSVIRNYLTTWARNKYKFYELLDHNLYKDYDIEYEGSERKDIIRKYEELEQEYPAFAPWLEIFKNKSDLKIKNFYDLVYDKRIILAQILDVLNITLEEIQGISLGRFLKKLKLPDELITKVTRIYENKKIKAKYTISIDPTDMMLASDNPYHWKSCYTLYQGEHADGTIAAVLDSSNLISYLWTKEGNFKLDNGLEMKRVRFKQERQTIAISPSFRNIHFNRIYPADNNMSTELKILLRDKIETLIANYLGLKNNVWVKNEENETYCYRNLAYGYSEYSSSMIYSLKDNNGNVLGECWKVFNEDIECPCGCGTILPTEDEYYHDGSGFRCDCYTDEYPYDDDDETE